MSQTSKDEAIVNILNSRKKVNDSKDVKEQPPVKSKEPKVDEDGYETNTPESPDSEW